MVPQLITTPRSLHSWPMVATYSLVQANASSSSAFELPVATAAAFADCVALLDAPDWFPDLPFAMVLALLLLPLVRSNPTSHGSSLHRSGMAEISFSLCPCHILTFSPACWP